MPVSDDPDGDIFRATYPAVRRLAGVVAPQGIEPDDLVQEALVRALRLGPLISLGDPAAYLCRAVINLAKNERRRLARQRRALARYGGDEPLETVYPSDLADLMELDVRERAVLFLYDVEGHTYQSIAQAIGGTEAATRRLASRARGRLRLTLSRRKEP